MLGDGGAVKLGSSGLALQIAEQLRVPPGDGRARPLAYAYNVGLHGRELLSFHWHPTGASPIRTPHLHVHAEIQVGDVWLHKAHLPTGPVSPVDVLRLLLDDFGVPPLRDDWLRAIEASRPD